MAEKTVKALPLVPAQYDSVNESINRRTIEQALQDLYSEVGHVKDMQESGISKAVKRHIFLLMGASHCCFNGGSISMMLTALSGIKLPDNEKIFFGDSNDLRIYHDSFHSYVYHLGTGDLRIRGNDILLQNDAGEDYLTATNNGAVRLYYDGSKKFETTNTGVAVSGYLATNTSGGIFLPDNSKILAGSSNDLQIFHDGSNSIITDAGAGNLELKATNLIFKNSAGTLQYASFISGGAAELRYNGSPKLATTNTGIDVTGTVTSDGLTVDGDATIKGGSDVSNTGATLQLESTETQAVGSGASISFKGDDGSGTQRVFGVIKGSKTSATSGEFNGGLDFFTRVTAEGNARKRLAIASNGDISFYDDTGSTQAFFWDASAERLGLGTTSPDALLEIDKGSEGEYLRVGGDNASNARSLRFTSSTASGSSVGALHTIKANSVGGEIAFANGNGNIMYLDVNRKVGIGTNSPDSPLHISAATEPYIRIENTDTALTEGQVVGGLAFEQNDSSGGGTGITGRIQMRSADRPDNGSYFGNVADMDFLVSGASNGGASDNATKTAMTIRAGTGSVGIGTDSPSTLLHLSSTDPRITLTDTSLSGNCNHQIRGADQFLELSADTGNSQAGSVIKFSVDGSEAGRFDTSGNLLVGTASSANTTDGVRITSGGYITIAQDAASVPTLYLNKITNDGQHINFQKDGTEIGSISTYSSGLDIAGSSYGVRFASSTIFPVTSAGSVADNVVSLGYSGGRFKDLHLSGTANVGGVKLTGTGTDNDSHILSFVNGACAIARDNNDLELHAYNAMVFGVSNTAYPTSVERARIDSSGNLLVGTTNASGSTAPDNSSDTNNAGLRLSGSLGFIGIGSNSQPTTYLNRIGSDGDIAIFKKDGSTVGSIGTTLSSLLVGTGTAGLLFSSSNSAIMPRNTSGANADAALKLGTSGSRFTDLHLSGTAYTGGYIRGSSSDANKLILKASSSTTELHAAGGTGLVFKGNGDNERARIDSSGNLLVGTTSSTSGITATSGNSFVYRPAGELTIARQGSGAYSPVAILNQTGDDGQIIDFRKDGTTVGNISTASGTTSYNTTSDARLKDVTGEARGLEVITKLNPVAYNWKADGKADEGLIAQEVKELAPNAVSKTEEGYYQMDYSKLVTSLIKAVQEQQEQIESLKSEINKLKGK